VGQTAPRAAAVQWQCVLLASAAAPGRHRWAGAGVRTVAGRYPAHQV